MEQHIYGSAKDEFLSFHEWVNLNATEEEKEKHFAGEPTDLYQKWLEAEQIISHKAIQEDGSEIELNHEQIVTNITSA